MSLNSAFAVFVPPAVVRVGRMVVCAALIAITASVLWMSPTRRRLGKEPVDAN